MYHRYLRNAQGEYQRKTIPDPPRQRESAPPPPPPGGALPHPAETAAAPRKKEAATPLPTPDPAQHKPGHPPVPPSHDPTLRRRREEADCAPSPEYGIPFLSKLFPNMDQGELLLLLILLLLLSEGTEDAASMAMTLAIFLFLQ